MRRFGLSLAGTLLTAALVAAQQPPPRLPAAQPPAAAPAPAPVDPTLDKYLLRWEQEMQKVQSLGARLSRTDKDVTFQSAQQLNGVAYYMKDGTGPSTLNRALLEMYRGNSKDIAEKFVCTGTFLYQYSPGEKEIRAYAMPKPRPGAVADDNFLSFMFGMKAEEAKRRYILNLQKEDADFIYVAVLPRFPADRADFKQARLVLSKKNYLPAQLWFKQPNNNEVLWDIPVIDTQMKLDARWFDKPEAPKGWKFVQVPQGADAPPKIYRNSGAP